MGAERSDQRVPGRWTRRQRDIGVAIWMAFLAACVGTFMLFAVIDPNGVSDDWVIDWQPGVHLVYGMAFFFLFAIALLSALLTGYMIRTGPRRGHARGKGRRRPPETHHPADGNPDLDDEDWY
ncbi:hypothetical protein F3N42_04975 [Marinihelvus fidelis]|uniref:Uncharacterized protein n=1 Tax=Marinihelvus fidelis TaxID=2613842 RepID=A0A5N0TC22_9GAMM|nr:hypothetical protein [Marinihelvus fidelis]KAA9132575.1 hypothetical protein F3N42_04975 [Marinihelvus fidelis]